MPRRDEDSSKSKRVDDDSGEDESDDYSTDSDCEYQLSTDMAREILGNHSVSERGVNDVYCSQRGVCRITGLPFASGMYSPVLVPRKCTEPVGDGNCMLVIEIIERMRSSTGMNWRTFVRFLQLAGKEAEL